MWTVETKTNTFWILDPLGTTACSGFSTYLVTDFSGFGPRKTIALFDTLVEKHTEDELVAVLAHEVGHYKKKHIFQGLIISIFQIGLMTFLLEL